MEEERSMNRTSLVGVSAEGDGVYVVTFRLDMNDGEWALVAVEVDYDPGEPAGMHCPGDPEHVSLLSVRIPPWDHDVSHLLDMATRFGIELDALQAIRRELEEARAEAIVEASA